MGSTFAAVRNWLTPSKTPRATKTFTPRGVPSAQSRGRLRTPLGEVQRFAKVGAFYLFYLTHTSSNPAHILTRSPEHLFDKDLVKVPTPVEMMTMHSSRKRGRDE